MQQIFDHEKGNIVIISGKIVILNAYIFIGLISSSLCVKRLWEVHGFHL